MERLGADLPADSTAGGVAGRLRWLLTTAGAFVRGSILPPVGSLALLFASMVVLDLANRIAADFGLGYLVIVAGYGVFMGTMIVARTHHLLAYGLCGFAALVITPLLGGVPVPLIVATPMIKTLAVVLAAVIMRSRLGRSTDLARPGVMCRFALVTMIGLPMLPGVTITLVRVWIGQQHIMALLPGIYLANALGCAITAPLVLSLHRGELHAALERGKRLGTVLTLALLCVGTLAVFELSRFQMLFMVLPLMLVVVLRLGLLGACLGCGLVAVIAICMTIAGEGPFSVMAVSPGFQNLRLQIFLAVLCIQSYPLAVVVQTRRSLEMGLIVRETRARFAEAKLRASEELHRALTENASDIVSRFSIDARRLYTSSSVTHILGFKPEELAGQGGLARIHPEDREAYLAVADQMRRGVERIGIVYRHARADGTWVWLVAVSMSGCGSDNCQSRR